MIFNAQLVNPGNDVEVPDTHVIINLTVTRVDNAQSNPNPFPNLVTKEPTVKAPQHEGRKKCKYSHDQQP
jgi:hypothetical protein